MLERDKKAIEKFIRRVERGTESQTAIGKSFGIDQSTTSGLIRGLTALGVKIGEREYRSNGNGASAHI